jgi:hypothetical protein
MSNKAFWIIGAISIATIPLVPDSMKFTITPPAALHTKYETQTKQLTCQLDKKFISAEGLQVCAYKCGDAIIYKSMFSKSIVCEQTIKERVEVRKY